MVEVADSNDTPFSAQQNYPAKISFKLLFLGDSQVGKANLMQSYVQDRPSSCLATSNIQNPLHKTLKIDDEETVSLELHKVPANQSVNSLQQAVGAFIVFDLSRR